MRSMAAQAWCAVHFAMLAGLPTSECAKLPSWRGPNTFFDGTLPSARDDSGFEMCDDGKIYIFGGYGPNGELIIPARCDK
jgi:hypothetical protein